MDLTLGGAPTHTYTLRLRFDALAFGAFCFGRGPFNFKLPRTKSCSGSHFRRRRLSHPTDAAHFLARAPRNGTRCSTVCKYVLRDESLRNSAQQHQSTTSLRGLMVKTPPSDFSERKLRRRCRFESCRGCKVTTCACFASEMHVQILAFVHNKVEWLVRLRFAFAQPLHQHRKVPREPPVE